MITMYLRSGLPRPSLPEQRDMSLTAIAHLEAFLQGGDALQIGPRASDVAPWFLPSPATFRAWIGRIAMPGAVVRHQDG